MGKMNIISRLYAFDIETIGTQPNFALQPWRVKSGEARIRCFSIASKDGVHGRALDTVQKAYITNILTKFIKFIIENDKILVCWNAIFELSWLAAYDVPKDMLYRLKVLDGMLLLKHAYNYASFYTENKKVSSFGLKEAVKLFLPDEAGYEKDVEFDGDIDTLLAYNKKDALFTYKIVVHLLQNEYIPKIAFYEAKTLPLFGYSLAMGLPINMTALSDLENNINVALDEVIGRLNTYHLTEKIINSPKQLAEFLFDKLQLDQTSFGRAVHKFAIMELYDRAVRSKTLVDMLADIIKYKELITKKRKFVEAAKKSVQYLGESKIHPYPVVFGTYSGRVTYSATVGSGKHRRYISWALHQTQRDKDVRALLIAPPGYVLVEFDAAGQEYRWMATMSDDYTMIELCNKGKDPHAHMGNVIYNIEHIDKITYEEFMQRLHDNDAKIKYYRHLGKIINLSCQYRIGAFKLRNIAKAQYNVDLTPSQASGMLDTYKATYVGVKNYWNKQSNNAMQCDYVTTLAGRRVLLPSKISLLNNSNLKWQAQSAAINFPIQGIGADQKYYALSALRQLLIDFDAWFAFDLHDGMYFFVPESRAKDFIKAALDVLNNLNYTPLVGKEIPVKMPFDCKYGKTWGDLKPVE